ncbi:hypothetical protein [Mobilicoccus caccae]|uniref:Uncharacterized protein n=1 Tax=Mobilicoccus caccae TaxID=1859295 RepID=A0ABQ6INJ6_9MICO|nr:hypothetical protein [Mobilicoccus caccae]GMA39006.1 hypothetical protein GCM10025883_10510 [Mobilicoccus caccae]
MGVRVTRRDGTVDEYGRTGDGAWTAERDDYSGTLKVSFLRAGYWEEVRRFYRSEEWARVEIR